MFDPSIAVGDAPHSPCPDALRPGGSVTDEGVDVSPDTLLAWAEEEPAGAAAASLLDLIDPHSLDAAGQVRLAVAWARVEAHAAARKLAAVAAVAGPEPSRGSAAERIDFAACEVGAALRLGSGGAHRLVHASRHLAARLPATAAALSSGRIGYLQALRIVEGTYGLNGAACHAVEERVLRRAPDQTPGQTGAAVTRAVAGADPKRFADRHREARRDTDAWLTHDDAGMGVLGARMPAVDATIVHTAMDGWARRHKASGDARTLGQLRCAALVDWAERFLTGPDAPRRHGRPVTVDVTVDLPTLLGLTDHPGEVLPGGLIPADALRDLIPHARLRRLVTDPLSGRLLDYGRRTYRPPADLAAFVVARDVTSTGPGATAPAATADLDHVVAWSDNGETSPANTHAVDRRWHRAKTLGGWTTLRNADGSISWTSPLGRSYRVEPHDYRLGP